jgi:hypothetical protein
MNPYAVRLEHLHRGFAEDTRRFIEGHDWLASMRDVAANDPVAPKDLLGFHDYFWKNHTAFQNMREQHQRDLDDYWEACIDRNMPFGVESYFDTVYYH